MNQAGWLLLVLTLPTANASARVRFWRALKALGCGAVRDGVYLLPSNERSLQALSRLSDEIGELGGTAHILDVTSRDESQQALLESLFDRSEDFDAFVRELLKLRKGLHKLALPEIQRTQQKLRREYESIVAIDHFPSAASAKAASAWQDFCTLVASYLAPDEPQATHKALQRLDRQDYQKRIWATRQKLWIDRVASAWLIRRFIDEKARFVWLAKAADCPRDALGFDFDGAAFTHVDERVTFEVLAASFGLDRDRGIARLGTMVHSLDVGGEPVAEAPGFEALMSAARSRGIDDDRLLAEMAPVLDAFYEFYAAQPTSDSA